MASRLFSDFRLTRAGANVSAADNGAHGPTFPDRAKSGETLSFGHILVERPGFPHGCRKRPRFGEALENLATRLCRTVLLTVKRRTLASHSRDTRPATAPRATEQSKVSWKRKKKALAAIVNWHVPKGREALANFKSTAGRRDDVRVLWRRVDPADISPTERESAVCSFSY